MQSNQGDPRTALPLNVEDIDVACVAEAAGEFTDFFTAHQIWLCARVRATDELSI